MTFFQFIDKRFYDLGEVLFYLACIIYFSLDCYWDHKEGK